MPEDVKKVNEEQEFFKDLIVEDEEETEETEEEKAIKAGQTQEQKDAEDARKRRVAELKEAKAAGFDTVDAHKAHLKAEKEKVEKEALAEAERKRLEQEAESKSKENKEETPQNKLGKQLVDFRTKYPNIELVELEKDASFKKFAKGKLLGSQNFIEIYEDYAELIKETSGKTDEEISQNYARKAGSSSGTSTSKGANLPDDVFTEEELAKLTARIPLMNDKEAAKVLNKYEKSIAFYKSKR